MSTSYEPVCQSCAMPLRRPEDFGTDAKGVQLSDYCCHCYLDGHFTSTASTLDAMVEHLVAMSGEMGMSPERARRLAREKLPNLKRWQAETTGTSTPGTDRAGVSVK